jgi:acetyl esterase/lipase
MIRWMVTVCVAAALAVNSNPGRADDTPQITADVVYGHKDGMALTFDVIRPAQANGAGIIFIPTGGWYSPYFDPKVAVAAGQPLLEKGFTYFVMRHGSAPKYTVPETVADVQRGVRYIRLHAADFGIDPNRLGVYGGSAGGHLTLMLATTGDDGKPDEKDEVLKGSSRVACVVAIFPPTDLRGWTTDPPEEIKKHAGLKPPLSFSADLEDDVSPLLHVSEKTSPVLLIHGDMDTLVPISHSQNIVPVLEKAQVEHKLLTIEGAGHGFNPEQQKVVTAAMVDWFVSHLAK